MKKKQSRLVLLSNIEGRYLYIGPKKYQYLVQNQISYVSFPIINNSDAMFALPDVVFFSVQKNDPTYEATKLHFQNLVERYGNQIFVLNLVKVW